MEPLHPTVHTAPELLLSILLREATKSCLHHPSCNPHCPIATTPYHHSCNSLETPSPHYTSPSISQEPHAATQLSRCISLWLAPSVPHTQPSPTFPSHPAAHQTTPFPPLRLTRPCSNHKQPSPAASLVKAPIAACLCSRLTTSRFSPRRHPSDASPRKPNLNCLNPQQPNNTRPSQPHIPPVALAHLLRELASPCSLQASHTHFMLNTFLHLSELEVFKCKYSWFNIGL